MMQMSMHYDDVVECKDLQYEIMLQPIHEDSEQPSPKRLCRPTRKEVASMGVPTDSLTSTFTQSLDLGCFKHLETCVSLLALGKFPLDKIAFLLFLDVVKWFSLDNTSAIYRHCKKITVFNVIYLTFHGRPILPLTNFDCFLGQSR